MDKPPVFDPWLPGAKSRPVATNGKRGSITSLLVFAAVCLALLALALLLPAVAEQLDVGMLPLGP